MSLKEFFIEGGWEFMSVLTFLLLLALALIVVILIQLFIKRPQNMIKIKNNLNHLQSLGLFSLVVGILGQLIGLYVELKYLSEVRVPSADIIYGGIKISMDPTLTGVSIFVICWAFWFPLNYLLQRLSNT